MKTLTILLLAISLTASAQKKYAIWKQPTKLHISAPVDSFKLVQRKQYAYYLIYAKGLEISSFEKPRDSVTSWLKKRI